MCRGERNLVRKLPNFHDLRDESWTLHQGNLHLQETRLGELASRNPDVVYSNVRVFHLKETRLGAQWEPISKNHRIYDPSCAADLAE